MPFSRQARIRIPSCSNDPALSIALTRAATLAPETAGCVLRSAISIAAPSRVTVPCSKAAASSVLRSAKSEPMRVEDSVKALWNRSNKAARMMRVCWLSVDLAASVICRKSVRLFISVKSQTVPTHQTSSSSACIRRATRSSRSLENVVPNDNGPVKRPMSLSRTVTALQAAFGDVF